MLQSFSKAIPALKTLNTVSSRGFAGIGNKRKATRRDLDKYDIVVVGGNLGAIFSRHLDDDAHGKYSMMVVFNEVVNQQWSLRTVYEQQRCAKTDYLINAKLAINMYTASEIATVEKFLPEENAIVLKNGRRIGYEQLVISMGLNENFDAVPGLEEAWTDVDHPVYVPKDHPSWRSFHHPYPRWHYNFTGGDAYFCIPPFPYKGEVSSLNFFISDHVWKWYKSYGKLSPKHSFTIVNANDNFSNYMESTDQFIKEKIQKLGLNVEYGVNLQSVNKEKHEAVFKNLKTGKEETRTYSQLYSIIPCQPHQQLVEAGLANDASNNMLDVDIHTLRHRKYKNIFGIGDVNNLPTTKSFWGGFHQVHVVRNNIQRNLKGQTLNAQYNGYTKSSILLSQNEITYAVHYYDQKPHFQHLLAKNGGIIANIRYYFWAKSQKKRFQNWYLKKSWGPPTFKLKRTFRELPADQEASQKSEGKSIFQALNRSVTEATEKLSGKSQSPVLETAGATAGTGSATDAATDAKNVAKSAAKTVSDTAKAAVDSTKGAAESLKETVGQVAQEQKGKLGVATGLQAEAAGQQQGQNIKPERNQAPKNKDKDPKDAQSKPSSK